MRFLNLNAFLFLISILWISSACDKQEDPVVIQQRQVDEIEEEEEDVPVTANPFTYLALGDSYTIGQGVDESDRWPVQLSASLRKRGVNMDDPQIIATTGWTTANLLYALSNREGLESGFDLVSLLIGVNNQFQSRPIEQFETEYRQLLDSALAYTGQDTSRVIVLSIPDYGVTPFGSAFKPERIAEEIDEYNRIKMEITEELGVAFFDITEISRQAATNSNLIATDNLHPSGTMYALWVEEVLSYVLDEFE